MPTNDPIAAARREAKTRVRKGGVTPRQALDAIAREAGHATWSAMTAALATTKSPVRAYVEQMRPHGGIAPDDELKALTEDAIHGYMEEPQGTDVVEYVNRYEFRGDGFDVTPDAFERDILENAITGYVAEERARQGLRGPYHTMPFELYDFPFLRGPDENRVVLERNAVEQVPALADVERDTRRIMERQRADGAAGITISQWISTRMRDAAHKGLATAGEPLAALAQLNMTTDNVAYAMDPKRGPYENVPKLTVHCPVHGGPDRHASLMIAGWQMSCMAGCDAGALETKFIERLCEAAGRARAFMSRNDRSPVEEGSANGGRGGMGGTYRLADGSRHTLDTLTCRLLPDGYPRWEHGSP